MLILQIINQRTSLTISKTACSLCWEVILHKSMASSTSCFFFLEWKNNSQYPNPNYPNAEIAKIGATLQDISRIVQLVQPIAELSYTDVFPYMVLRLVFNEE